MYIQTWYNKGIHTVGDIVDLNQQILPSEELKKCISIKNIDFLTYGRIKILLKDFFTDSKIDKPTIMQYQKPNIPYYYEPLRITNSGIRPIYNILNTDYNLDLGNEKWNRDLVNIIDETTWKNTYQICFTTVQDNYLIWLQYRILNRILGTNYYTHKLKITNTPQCNICNDSDQTIKHLFCECPKIKMLWENIIKWIKNKLNISITLSPLELILGYQHKNNYAKPLNMIILATKAYTFWCAQKNVNPDIAELLTRIETTYNEQNTIALKTSKSDIFNKHWIIWK